MPATLDLNYRSLEETALMSKVPEQADHEPRVSGMWAAALSRFLKDTGGAPAGLPDFHAESRYLFADIEPLWAGIHRRFGVDGGIRFAQWLAFPFATPLLRPLLMADRLTSALRQLSTHLARISEAGRITVSVDHQGACTLNYWPWADSWRFLDMQIEAATLCIVRLSHWLTESKVAPDEVCFVHNIDGDRAARLETAFGTAVRGRGRCNRLKFSVEQANAPIAPHVLEGIRYRTDSDADVHQDSLAWLVESVLLEGWREWGRLSRGRVAQTLGMSERTLVRRLAEEQHTFKALQDRVYRQIVGELLMRTDMSIEKVAVLADYADGAAFTRACQRLLGATPVAFRRMKRVY